MTTLTQPEADGADRSSPLFTSTNRLKMAAFHMNCNRGATPTFADGVIAHLDWDQQVRIARAAEAAGLEAIIPIARWRGYGGASDFNGEQYEAMPWAAGIAAATSRIAVFATAHVPLIHPVRLAKEVATIDHIAGGRFCLNVVAGFNLPEFAMFGIELPGHDERYAVAAEWIGFVKRLWASDEEFDFHGTYYDGSRAISRPKPIQRPRPPIMSAGSSPAGCEFAARHADICFATADTIADLARLSAEIKERASRHGRSVEVWAQTGMLCAETEGEAKRRYDHFVHERGDWEAVENQMRLLMGGDTSQSLSFELSRTMLERMIAWQHGQRLVGTPEQIVDRLEELSAAGIDGITVIWMDYEREIEEFREMVLPLAIDAGLRSA